MAAIPDAAGGNGARGGTQLFAVISQWFERQRAIRRRWQADARRLITAEEANAYYEAQRPAARARVRGEKFAFYHWAKVAAEIARISPQAEMDIEKVTAIVAEEERRNR